MKGNCSGRVLGQSSVLGEGILSDALPLFSKVIRIPALLVFTPCAIGRLVVYWALRPGYGDCCGT